tara:strand:+ start:1326 stop:2324 length:999 start_codon:yes stop_codon:yes gene_type:complete
MSILLAKSKDYKEIILFINKYYVKNHILVKNKKLFDNFYKNNQNYNLLIYRENNKIISILGFINYSKYSKNRTTNLIWLALWASKHNSYGAGLKLLKNLENKFKNCSIIGLGLTDKALLILKMIDYKINHLNHYYLTNAKLKKFKIIKRPAKNNYIKSNNSLLLKKLTNLEFKKIDFNTKNKYKNKNYFINKYYKNKFYKYNFYFIKNNSNSNFIILICRTISVRRINIIRIIEIIGDSKILRNSYYALQSILNNNQAEYIDCLNYGIPKSHFFSGGFKEIQNGTIVPNYFEPFKSKSKKIYFAYKKNKYIEKKLNIFKGDGDQERPNKIRE